MLYRSPKPKKLVLHRKVNAERRCVCGAKLTCIDGEFVHPKVK